MCAFVLALIFLPQWVSAATDQVTEVADFRPAADDYDETRNIANETITTNIDTWNPRPEGIFVGGVIEESKMRVNEVGTGTVNYLTITTKMRFSPDYLSSGASMCVIRFPLYIGPDNSTAPNRVSLTVYEFEDAAEYSFNTGGIGISVAATNMKMIGYMADCARLSGGPSQRYTGMSYDSWVSDERLYARLVMPLLTDRDYLFVASCKYAQNTPFDIYWQPSDLCSDNILETRVVYKWAVDPSQNLIRDYPVDADAGWSFVFQKGIGGVATDYDDYFAAGDSIFFYKLVPTATLTVTGRITFILEFRTNYSEELNYTLRVDWMDVPTGGTHMVLSDSYWNHLSAKNVIVAGTDTNYTVTGCEFDDQYYALFRISLVVNNATRLQLMTYYDTDVPGRESEVGLVGPVMHNQADIAGRQIFFAPWCTIEIAPYSYNKSYPELPAEDSGFWAGVGRWWDRHWVDVVGCVLIIAGAALVATGVGGGFGLALIGTGITMILYNNVDWIRDAINNFVSMAIDGLTWLGNWLWKIGMAIWKAITWFVDALVNAGTQLLAILIFAMAIILPIVVLTIVTKLMSVFAHIAEGDFAGAAGEAMSAIPGTGFAMKKVKRFFR